MEERAECIVSDVVVRREAIGLLVLFAPKPFQEKNGGVVDEKLGHGTEVTQRLSAAGLAIVKAQMVQPTCSSIAYSPIEDD